MKSDIKKKKTKTRINTKPQLPGVDGAVNAVANNVVETLKNVPKTYKTKENLAEALKKKSKKSGISLKIVLEVFKRGALSWDDTKSGDKIQSGFNRLNSYIAGGKARELDADLTETKSYAIATRSAKSKTGWARVKDTKFGSEESAKNYGDKYHTDKHGSKLYKVVPHPNDDLSEKINTTQKELSRESKVINKIREMVLNEFK